MTFMKKKKPEIIRVAPSFAKKFKKKQLELDLPSQIEMSKQLEPLLDFEDEKPKKKRNMFPDL